MPQSTRLGFVLAAALTACTGSASAASIGVATAVLPAARGTPPAESARILQVGLDIEANERVETDADGKAHLIFLDGSALTVGPNSDLMLDEYVYDPDQRLGRLAISLSRGVLRFVGGGISKRTPVEIRTPTATMGIRGGVAILEVGEQVAATFLFGAEMTLSAGGITQRVDRPGFRIAIDPSGVPQDPVPVDATWLAATLTTLETTRSIGAPQVTDDDVAETQIELLNSTGGLGEIDPAAGGGPLGPPLPQPFAVNDMAQLSALFAAPPSGDEPGSTPGEPAPAPTPPPPGTSLPGSFTGRATQGGSGLAGGGLALVRGAFVDGVFLAETEDGRLLTLVETEDGRVSSSAQPFGPGVLSGGYLAPAPQFLLFHLVDELGGRVFAFAGQPTAPDAGPDAGVSAYPLLGDFVSGRALPFIEDVGHAGGAAGPAAASGPGRVYVAWDNSAPDAKRAFGGGSVAIFGAGPDQQAAAVVIFGEVLEDLQARPHVSARLFGERAAGQDLPAFYSGAISSADGGDGSDLFGPAANFVLDSAEVDAADAVLSRGVLRSEVGGGAPAALYAQHATGLPVTQTGARTSRTLSGFAAGLERTFELRADGPTSTGTAVLSTFGSRGVAIESHADRNAVSASFDFVSSAERVSIGFGEAVLGGDAFIDDRTFFAGTSPTSVLRNDAVRPGVYAMITASELQHDDLLPAGVEFCVCEHLVWGFFAGERELPPSSDKGLARRRSLDLATWVAGEPSSPSQIVGFLDIDAGVQTASYRGHMIGSVSRAGGVYRAVGGLELGFSFSPGAYRAHSATIVDFDGLNLSGGPTPELAANRYSVPVATADGAAQTVSGTLNGAFFGPGSPPENTAGDFRLLGAGYQAAGTFAAAR